MSDTPILNTRLLQRAARIASVKLDINRQLSLAFEKRYGVDYSEVDCDELIDILDYFGGSIDLKSADEAMTKAGYPPLKTLDMAT